jgi:hypothetical protein
MPAIPHVDAPRANLPLASAVERNIDIFAESDAPLPTHGEINANAGVYSPPISNGARFIDANKKRARHPKEEGPIAARSHAARAFDEGIAPL